MSFSHAWRALRHRNFQLFFVGQGISITGTWMTKLATSWLIYELTHSAFLLGIVSFSGHIVSFLLQPFAGVWVERVNRRKLLIWTQVAASAQSLILAALTLAHAITLREIIALTVFQGLLNAFDTPARQSFFIQMVENRDDLSNAIAISSSMTNGGKIIGPAIAGLIIAAVGAGWCFFIDGISYFAVIASLLFMHVKPLDLQKSSMSLWEQMKEGWNYVSKFRPVRSILLIFSLTALMGYPFTVLLPVFAEQVLHGGPHTLGWLTGSYGTGALVSALSLTLRKSVLALPRMIQIAAGVLGLSLILFGCSQTLWLSIVFLFFAGFGLMQTASAANTIIQAIVPEDKRARVMSFYIMAFFGSAPLGSLLAGVLADKWGAPATVIFTGAFCVAGSIWFMCELPKIKILMEPVYLQMGLTSSKKLDTKLNKTLERKTHDA